MNLYNIIYDYPIGSKVHIQGETENTLHEVSGYEWYNNTGILIFEDGSKVNIGKLKDGNYY